MEEIIKVLKMIFYEHWAALLLLSVSWLLVYLAFVGVDLIARKVLLRLPFFLDIQINRLMLGLVKQRHKIIRQLNKKMGDQHVSRGDEERLALEVGKLYSSVDKKITRIKCGEHWVNKLLRQESVNKELESIKNGEWAVLESDFAFCEAISGNRNHSVRGLLNFIGNPEPRAAEKRGLLSHTLKFGQEDTKRIALYLIENDVSNYGECFVPEKEKLFEKGRAAGA